MTNVTVSNEEKFGALILRLAKERLETPQGKKELQGFNTQQFIEILGRLTKEIDDLPGTHDVRALYLALNWLAAHVVQVMEQTEEYLKKQTGGSA